MNANMKTEKNGFSHEMISLIRMNITLLSIYKNKYI